MAVSNPFISENVSITLIEKRKKARVWEIDFIRGICVLLMILDHLAMLIGGWFGNAWYGRNFAYYGIGDSFTLFCAHWINSPERAIIHPIVLFIFFSISGISCTFSRSNFKRGLQLLGVAVIYSIGSYIAQECIGLHGVLVTFGVLQFLAVSILLYATINFLGKDSAIFDICASIVLIVLTLCLYFCYTPPKTTPKFFSFIFPSHDLQGNPIDTFYMQYEVSPGDMFPMIPYTAFYFAGVIIGRIFYSVRTSYLPRLDRAWHKPVTFVGRHALVVYALHVVIMAGILALITYAFITPGQLGF